jgi:hypothetical protein
MKDKKWHQFDLEVTSGNLVFLTKGNIIRVICIGVFFTSQRIARKDIRISPETSKLRNNAHPLASIISKLIARPPRNLI